MTDLTKKQKIVLALTALAVYTVVLYFIGQ